MATSITGRETGDRAQARAVRSAPRAPAAGPSAPEASAFDWRRRYAWRLRLTDLVTIVVVIFGTQVAWIGVSGSLARAGAAEGREWPYTLLSTIIVVLWMFALALNDTRSDRVVGVGLQEYKRIVDATVVLFGLIAIAAFLLRVEIARGYLLIAFPLGIAALLLERGLWRRWLGRQRRKGRYVAEVLLVGSERSVADVARELRRTVKAGYRVVGACVPTGKVGARITKGDIPVMGTVDAVDRALEATGADTVVITSADELGIERVKRISWMLEAGRQHLVLAPSITDIAGPRIHARPVAGLPLMHVETPRFEAGQRFLKRTGDLVTSLLLILLLSPVFVVLAAVVKFSSPGPIIYRQARVGRHGEEFGMLKFRTMVADADDQLESLLDLQGTRDRPLFKVVDDPRITPVGRFLRRYSLDELPQLFNVLSGEMSLVGPRPQRPAEVALYDDAAHRRLLVKPGMSGLWQVSGRSSLEWEDALRLDLYYVENWSFVQDFVILLRTVRAVIRPGDTVV